MPDQQAPDPVQHQLDTVWSAGTQRSQRLGPDHENLWNALRESSEGGKRFRPGLVVSVHSALGGQRPQVAARVGAAVEMLHTALVVHDDVIDADDHRRGRPNVSGIFARQAGQSGAGAAAAQHRGSTAGILAGDLALVSAVRLMAQSGAPETQTNQLLELMEDAIHSTTTGELADVCLSLAADGAVPRLEDALRVASLKTGVYSFQLPMQAGAILAAARAELVEELGVIGRLIGTGFQLLDDLLGVFGQQEVIGKGILSDLREGKPTALLVHARALPLWEELRELIGDRALDDQRAAQARELLTQSRARAAVQTLAEHHLDEALRRAARPTITAPLEAVVVELIAGLRAAASYGLGARGAPEPSFEAPVQGGAA